MRRTASQSIFCIPLGNEDITAHEARCQAQATRRFDHQHREVPAATATTLQRLARTLYTLLAAADIEKLFFYGERYGPQQAHGFGCPGWIQELGHPPTNVIAGVVMDQRPRQVWHFIR